MAIQWEQTQFDDCYSALDGDPAVRPDPQRGNTVGYGKRFMQLVIDPYTPHRTFGIRRARRIAQEMDDLDSLNIQPNARILIVGSAFGDLMRAIRNPNTIPGDSAMTARPNVWGLDHSTWIENNIAVEGAGAAVSRTIWADMMDYALQATQDALTAMTGGTTFRMVITEDVVSSFTPAELPAFLDICESAITGTNFSHIIHYTTTLRPGQSPFASNATVETLRWLRLSQWANQRDSHSWLGQRGQFIKGV